MPETDKIPIWGETQEAAQDIIPTWEETSDVKKKDDSGAGLPGGELQTPDQDLLLPGYQEIIKKGKIPVNPFEKAALGQPAVNESKASAYTGGIPVQQKPKKQPSVYDQALDDTEKWFGNWPSPREKIESFNKGAAAIKEKYQAEVDKGIPIEDIQANYDAELSALANKIGGIWENGDMKV